MNEAAEAVMRELPDLVIAYGNSDEYRYLPDLRKLHSPLLIKR